MRWTKLFPLSTNLDLENIKQQVQTFRSGKNKGQFMCCFDRTFLQRTECAGTSPWHRNQQDSLHRFCTYWLRHSLLQWTKQPPHFGTNLAALRTQWHWTLPPYSATVFQGFTDVSYFQGIPGTSVHTEGPDTAGPDCCPALRSPHSATVCDFNIKALCSVSVKPSNQFGKILHLNSFWSSLHFLPVQSLYK